VTRAIARGFTSRGAADPLATSSPVRRRAPGGSGANAGGETPGNSERAQKDGCTMGTDDFVDDPVERDRRRIPERMRARAI